MPSVESQAALQTAIVPCLGLGDALISCILAHHLKEAGHTVTVFHPILTSMASLFPGIEIAPRPEYPTFFESHQRAIVFYEKLDWMQRVLENGLNHHRQSLTVLNPIATPNRDYPFWDEGAFDGTLPFVDNLMTYLAEKEGVADPKRCNGITLPSDLQKRKHIERVILHPTSSRAGKNWTKEKYLELASRLEARGLQPAFILTKEEAKHWPEITPPQFESLVELTHFIAESGYMIGNDSGIGHLASCVGVPTLTICRSKMTADFWRPAFGPGKVVVPPKWIPNLKGMRWRDQKWQHFVPVSQVEKAFLKLIDGS